MAKGLAIVNGYGVLPGIENFLLRMTEEFKKLGVQLDHKKTTDVLAFVQNDGMIHSPLDAYDFILFLDKDMYLSELLEKLGYRLFNSAESIRLCDDKMLTHITLSQNGVPMPKTIATPLNYLGLSSPEFIENVEKELSYPIIGKSCFGSMGNSTYLLRKRENLARFLERNIQAPTLLQEQITSSYGFDYRFIVIGGKFVAAMERRNDSDFRSNLAQGGHGRPLSPKQSFIDLAEKAAKLMGCDYCGVDLLADDKGEPILCEVNSNAFIAGIEKTTGINVAGIYAKYILETIGK